MTPDATSTTGFDIAAARRRCLAHRRRILDISQQVSALHGAAAFSATEIVDCIYHGLMRGKPAAHGVLRSGVGEDGDAIVRAEEDNLACRLGTEVVLEHRLAVVVDRC